MLFSPLTIGAISLQHRVVMAPLTRMRAAQPGNTPHALNVEYYRQRATNGGLIIAEATQINQQGQGYPATPGIHSDLQVQGWREITDAVHAKGGRIVLQLWHVGRLSHSSYQPDAQLPVAPSAVAAEGMHFSSTWTSVPFETPRAMETTEVEALADHYRSAAVNAMNAGFDGVELHGANGYLIEQFLLPSINYRSDRYGGSLANRTRLLLEATTALIEVVGADRVGIRLSPFGAGQTAADHPLEIYRYAISALAEMQPAYLHLVEPRIGTAYLSDAERTGLPVASELFRENWPGVLLAAGGYHNLSAQRALKAGHADAIAFGRAFIANPDLVSRLQSGAQLTSWNRGSFYGGGAAGYTDYPFQRSEDKRLESQLSER